jgi:hypothetical protein
MQRTVLALVQRGIDVATAERLAGEKYTLSSLARLTPAKLDALDVPESARRALNHLDRPPIDADVVHSLLYESKFTCCMCRKGGKGFIIHHIEPWENSHSHEAENLVVLCTGCHDLAHTRRELSRSITADDIRRAKGKWIARVKEIETDSVFAVASWRLVGVLWDYFNPQRLIRAGNALGIEMPQLKELAAESIARSAESRRQRYRYEGRCGRDLEYDIYEHLLRAICHKRSVINLRSIWTRSQMTAVLRPQALVAVHGYFRFKPSGEADGRGPGQMRLGYLQRRNIRLEFTFDAWEATSSSSWSHHLRRAWNSTAICVVRSATRKGDLLKLNATVLAIGTGFGDEEPLPKPAIAHEREMEAEAEWDEENAFDAD